MYYADEPHYDSKHVRCPMAVGEQGVLTMQLLFKHNYVYLCSLFVHIEKKHIDPYVANMLYQGLRELIFGEIDYAPSVATSCSELSLPYRPLCARALSGSE